MDGAEPGRVTDGGGPGDDERGWPDQDRGDLSYEPEEAGSGAGFLPGMASYEEPPYGRRPPRRRAGRIAAISVVIVVVAVVAGAFAVKAMPRKQDNAGYHATASTASGAAKEITAAFLRAWSGGGIGTAASLTDDPAAARTALTAYARDLHLRKLAATVTSSSVLTPEGGSGSATGAAAATTLETVAFTADATVAGSAAPGAVSGAWSYESSLIAYQVPDGTGWFVEWEPSIMAPGLDDGQHLATALVPATGGSVTDSAGNPLSSYGDPGLTTVATMLTQDPVPAATTAGTPGLAVRIEDASGRSVSGGQTTITDPKAGHLVTTIDPKAERAAQSAVAATGGSAIVVIAPATGHILAIANNAADNDYALTAAVAPGSAMKIITATALLNPGLVTENASVACPKTYTVQGITYHNDQGESEPAGTPFADDFARSCNNAFAQWWQHLSGQLAATAKTYYGLDQPWNIGLPGHSASYFSAPASASGSELAQEAFGEGALTASPLAMASVAATVDAGVFRQPVLVSRAAGSSGSAPTVPAQPLPASTDEQLKDMMRDVVTEGTADGIGFGPDVYAKTGTADVQGQEQPNSWMVAFDPSENAAVADLVVNAGYGAQVAGPEVKAFFDGY